MRISHGAVLSVQLLTHAIDVADLFHDCFNDVFSQERNVVIRSGYIMGL